MDNKNRFKIVTKYILTGECGVLVIRDYQFDRRLEIPIAIDLYDVFEVGYEFGSVDEFLYEMF